MVEDDGLNGGGGGGGREAAEAAAAWSCRLVASAAVEEAAVGGPRWNSSWGRGGGVRADAFGDDDGCVFSAGSGACGRSFAPLPACMSARSSERTGGESLAAGGGGGGAGAMAEDFFRMSARSIERAGGSGGGGDGGLGTAYDTSGLLFLPFHEAYRDEAKRLWRWWRCSVLVKLCKQRLRLRGCFICGLRLDRLG